MSTGSGLSGLSGMTRSSNPYYRLPEKLRIVKPLEGKQTYLCYGFVLMKFRRNGMFTSLKKKNKGIRELPFDFYGAARMKFEKNRQDRSFE